MNNKKLIQISLICVFAIAPCLVNSADESKAGQYLNEFDQALVLNPNLENGRELYKMCIACHGPEGWGSTNGSGAYPQIAGQLPGVLIKQLADLRKGNRDSPIMRAFTTVRALGGPQDIADVAGYIASLPMTAFNGQGFSRDLELGRNIYQRDCMDCHGENGEGDAEQHVPIIYGQHYQYLVRQYRWIRNGRRRNANKEMVAQIQNYTLREEKAVLAYTASLKPPEDKVAEPGWKNPDFPGYSRGWRSNALRER